MLDTFNQTTVAATSGKLTFGLAAAIWSASVGFSAIQDSLNVVYRVKETRSYVAARLSAIGVTILLMVLITLMLASLLGADFFERICHVHIYHHFLAAAAGIAVRSLAWTFAIILLSLLFAVIYYFAPDVKASHWHWLTPGSAVGIVGWILASLGLRAYVHFFNNYTVAYGGLGAVIVLLDLVLSHRPDASAGRRNQQRNRGRRRSEASAPDRAEQSRQSDGLWYFDPCNLTSFLGLWLQDVVQSVRNP